MAKSIKDIKKKIGRPRTTGSGDPQLVRMHPGQLAAIDKWRGEDITRPEAIRRLVEIGLTAAPPARTTNGKAAARAAELAANVIEKHIDSSAPVEERDRRKRRLLKGPSVFREVRFDKQKTK